jgi:hypothetical protein
MFKSIDLNDNKKFSSFQSVERSQNFSSTSNKIEKHIKRGTVLQQDKRIIEENELTKEGEELEVVKKVENLKIFKIGFYTGGLDKTDQPTGSGLMKYEDGSRYDGDFVNGKKEGKKYKTNNKEQVCIQ